MENIWPILAGLCGLGLGFLIDRAIKGSAYRTRNQLLADAQKDVDSFRRDQEVATKEQLLKRKETLEHKLDEAREKTLQRERDVDQRELQLKEQLSDSRKKEQMLQANQQKLVERSKAMEARQKELNRVLQESQEQLQQISGMNKDEAQELLLKRVEDRLSSEIGGLILKHESEVKDRCDVQAREIIGMAVQRYASAHTSEIAVSTVDIPSDEMKGRIIGREGRNIRAFEKETGVDVIVDDTPGVVIISAFDSVRREIGRQSLQKLIQDGRIHPTRIEEIVKETQKEMDETIRRLGIEACEEAGIRGLHNKIIDLMGRLHFRVSYSQNVRKHSVEVSHLTGLLAEQLGLDGTLARRCGFLHDIGKAADHEMEGGHPAVGAELLKRYGENEEVVHAAAGHHDDIRPEYIYTVLVAAADAISAARPGARRETLEKYVKRLEELEGLACGFPGVQQAYAVQAGREVRIIVDPEQINDRQATKMTRDISEAIEQSLTYPGEIKVTVLRETRTVQFAK